MDINVIEKELNLTYRKRYNRRQKNAFKDYVETYANDLGYEVNIQGSKLSQNIIFGDLEKANILIGAHYDTPFFSRHITIITRLFGYWLGQLILIPVILGLSFFLAYILTTTINISNNNLINFYISLIFTLCICFFILMPFPFSNPHNANDNTSGVLGVLSSMQKLPRELREKVAFVLFDNEEWGLLGSASLAKYIKKNNTKKKFVINMDCIGLGEHYYICGKKHRITELLAESLQEEINGKIKISNFKYAYPTDHINFTDSLSICVYSKSILTKTVSLKYYHSPNDKIIDLNKIEKISNAIIKTIINC